MTMGAVWVIAVVGWFGLGVFMFAILERYAFRNNVSTLSRFVWETTNKAPLITVVVVNLIGWLQGGLAVHFFWHWCPDLGLGTG